jgi:hypothetical protein
LRSFIGVSWAALKMAGCDDEYPTRFSAAWGKAVSQLVFGGVEMSAPMFLIFVFPWWRNSTSLSDQQTEGAGARCELPL